MRGASENDDILQLASEVTRPVDERERERNVQDHDHLAVNEKANSISTAQIDR